MVLAVFRAGSRGLAIAAAAFACVLIWWLSLQPSNERRWQPDVEQTAWAEINGDQVTIHNLRNCDDRTETDYTPVWETRTVNLSQLRGVDVFMTYWIFHQLAAYFQG